MPLSLSHRQLQHVMAAARDVPQEKRDQFLQRLSTMLALKGRFDDRDVADVAKLAATGLSHPTAA
jgi:hypothetical protein